MPFCVLELSITPVLLAAFSASLAGDSGKLAGPEWDSCSATVILQKASSGTPPIRAVHDFSEEYGS
jgi:hypothetical protein